MPRAPRVEIAGGTHHVTARSPSGRLLFVDDVERQMYLSLLGRQVARRGWSVTTFCLMTNHLHLLVETPEADLGLGIKAAHQTYAAYINRTREETGHLYGARFKSKPVLSDDHHLACFRYIARNPVEAGMCSSPGEYAWSAHCALAGLAPAPSFLAVKRALRGFGGPTLPASQRNYVRYVARSDEQVLAELFRSDSDRWMVTARDVFDIPIATITSFLSTGRRGVYKRLAAARTKKGTEGSVP